MPSSSARATVLDGQLAIGTPTLSQWDSERWGAMCGLVGCMTHSAFMKSTTSSSRTVADLTASTGETSLSPCSCASFRET